MKERKVQKEMKEKPLTLAPLDFEQALENLLQVKPEKKDAPKKKQKPKKQGK